MALVTTKEMFRKAYEGKYAIGAFNVDNIDIMQGVSSSIRPTSVPRQRLPPRSSTSPSPSISITARALSCARSAWTTALPP